MKKIASILLILILFFNWYGYRLVTAMLEKKSDKNLEARLDNHEYNEADLIEIRIALNLPYQNNQSEFERCYGEIELKGKYYTYVKRKIENGFLVLKCISNSSKQEIKSAGNDFFKMANGLDQNQNKQNAGSSAAKNFWSEYDDRLHDFRFSFLPNINAYFLNFPSSLFNINLSTPPQPPEMLPFS